MLPPYEVDLLVRAGALVRAAGRSVLGIVGPPGAGKSTLAQRLVNGLGDVAALVSMDGFHLADAELVRLGLADRKGSPETFDAAGYVALLHRLRQQPEEVVYAPLFRRELELAEAGAVPVAPSVRLVITEGNYLLTGGAFASVHGLLEECWYVDLDDDVRRRRLVARHLRNGRDREQAQLWVEQTDEPNAMLVRATRSWADLIVNGE